MMDIAQREQLVGRKLIGNDGEKLGTVDELYLDEQGGQPEWALVSTGLFGTKKAFVPLRGATTEGDEVRVPVSKAQVKDAPHIDADQELSEAEGQRLFEYYGVPYTTEGSTTATGAPTTGAPDTAAGTTGRDLSGPTTDDAMTRSEEELRVGTTRREAGRARLRKYIVTEQVQTTVPVQREEVRVEREPITDANVDQALDGPELSEEEHEVTLHAEEPVVEKRVVPKERVRLEKDTHVEEQQVGGEVRKEQIETEGDALR